ncbi:cell division protein FtsY-like protein, partial [Haemophilus influenzae HK1212]
MAEENKKGGFWASLFGRNKKQDEPKIEPIIEEEKINDVEQSVEKFGTSDLVEEPSELETVESAVDSEPFLVESIETNEIVEDEKIQEISTALEPVEEIIEAKNLEDDLPITETVVESEI